MKGTLYHGTNVHLAEVASGSWLTLILGQAILQAEKRVRERGGEAYVHVIAAGDDELRAPDATDRTRENMLNAVEDETCVRIARCPLGVARSISGNDLVRQKLRHFSPSAI